MIIRLKEGEREREKKNESYNKNNRQRQGQQVPEQDISYLYLREASQRAMSPDCSWHPLLQGYVVVNSGLKKGSMCEWRCYERVLKNWDYFTQNMKARDSPFTTNSSLTFSHPNLKWSNTQLSSCCWKCSSVWQNVLNPHCYFMVTDIKLITIWCAVYCIFWVHIDQINSAARMPAADQPFGGACFTMATLFICCGALGEAERNEVKRNWKSDPPPKTVKWHSNNPETLAWTCFR